MTTDRTVRIFAQTHFAPFETGRIQQQQATAQRGAKSDEQLQAFKRLQAADNPHQRGQYPVMGATLVCFGAFLIQR